VLNKQTIKEACYQLYCAAPSKVGFPLYQAPIENTTEINVVIKNAGLWEEITKYIIERMELDTEHNMSYRDGVTNENLIAAAQYFALLSQQFKSTTLIREAYNEATIAETKTVIQSLLDETYSGVLKKIDSIMIFTDWDLYNTLRIYSMFGLPRDFEGTKEECYRLAKEHLQEAVRELKVGLAIRPLSQLDSSVVELAFDQKGFILYTKHEQDIKR
jgi:hypothetical protein